MFMSLAPLIKEIEAKLKERATTKAAFCTDIGVQTQHYNNWRHRGIPAARLPAIAEYFGWDESSLLRGVIAPATTAVNEPGATYTTQQYPNLIDALNTLPENMRQPTADLLTALLATLSAHQVNNPTQAALLASLASKMFKKCT